MFNNALGITSTTNQSQSPEDKKKLRATRELSQEVLLGKQKNYKDIVDKLITPMDVRSGNESSRAFNPEKLMVGYKAVNNQTQMALGKGLNDSILSENVGQKSLDELLLQN